MCVRVEDFAACFLQVSPPYHETEKPTSPSTSRTSQPARRTRSTRPRTPNNQVAHTERTRRWTVVVFFLWVFFFLLLLLLCYAAFWCRGMILTIYSYVLYSRSLLERIEYFYFGKSLTMKNGTNKKKKYFNFFLQRWWCFLLRWHITAE